LSDQANNVMPVLFIQIRIEYKDLMCYCSP